MEDGHTPDELAMWAVENHELLIELFLAANIALVAFCIGMVYGSLG